jgi:hypothetical protein
MKVTVESDRQKNALSTCTLTFLLVLLPDSPEIILWKVCAPQSWTNLLPYFLVYLYCISDKTRNILVGNRGQHFGRQPYHTPEEHVMMKMLMMMMMMMMMIMMMMMMMMMMKVLVMMILMKVLVMMMMVMKVNMKRR